MTEDQWLTTTRPYDLTYHKACLSDRKRRLLSCACARRVLDLVPDARYAAAVDTAERYADGLATQDEMRATRRLMNRLWTERNFTEAGNHAATAALATLTRSPVGAVHGLETAAAARAAEARPRWDAGHAEETRFQCLLARDVFANPFRPVVARPGWLTPTVLALARGIYADRAFHRLPVLADALEEAGCGQPDLLGHCRGDGPHVPGCWLIDLLLRKS